MTSLKQIESNRRNALMSTGPTTKIGKRRSRRNAMRHGLTAETVVELLEEPKDYKAFEMSITAEFNAQTAVERELVLRLASVLWRLRRSTAIETGLLQIHSETTLEPSEYRAPCPDANAASGAPFGGLAASSQSDGEAYTSLTDGRLPMNDDHGHPEMRTAGTSQNRNVGIARCFQRLAHVDNGAFERLSRYETALRRQVGQLLFMLNVLNGRGRRQIDLLRVRRDNPFLLRNRR
jgi:hypothetical protein